jgi:hypothetical protein
MQGESTRARTCRTSRAGSPRLRVGVSDPRGRVDPREDVSRVQGWKPAKSMDGQLLCSARIDPREDAPHLARPALREGARTFLACERFVPFLTCERFVAADFSHAKGPSRTRLVTKLTPAGAAPPARPSPARLPPRGGGVHGALGAPGVDPELPQRLDGVVHGVGAPLARREDHVCSAVLPPWTRDPLPRGSWCPRAGVGLRCSRSSRLGRVTRFRAGPGALARALAFDARGPPALDARPAPARVLVPPLARWLARLGTSRRHRVSSLFGREPNTPHEQELTVGGSV